MIVWANYVPSTQLDHISDLRGDETVELNLASQSASIATRVIPTLDDSLSSSNYIPSARFGHTFGPRRDETVEPSSWLLSRHRL